MIPFFMFLANFIFAVSHLKIRPAVHLNTSKPLTFRSQKEKFIKSWMYKSNIQEL